MIEPKKTTVIKAEMPESSEAAQRLGSGSLDAAGEEPGDSRRTSVDRAEPVEDDEEANPENEALIADDEEDGAYGEAGDEAAGTVPNDESEDEEPESEDEEKSREALARSSLPEDESSMQML